MPRPVPRAGWALRGHEWAGGAEPPTPGSRGWASPVPRARGAEGGGFGPFASWLSERFRCGRTLVSAGSQRGSLPAPPSGESGAQAPRREPSGGCGGARAEPRCPSGHRLGSLSSAGEGGAARDGDGPQPLRHRSRAPAERGEAHDRAAAPQRVSGAGTGTHSSAGGRGTLGGGRGSAPHHGSEPPCWHPTRWHPGPARAILLGSVKPGATSIPGRWQPQLKPLQRASRASCPLPSHVRGSLIQGACAPLCQPRAPTGCPVPTSPP